MQLYLGLFKSVSAFSIELQSAPRYCCPHADLVGVAHAGPQEEPLAVKDRHHLHVVGVWEEVPGLQ